MQSNCADNTNVAGDALGAIFFAAMPVQSAAGTQPRAMTIALRAVNMGQRPASRVALRYFTFLIPFAGAGLLEVRLRPSAGVIMELGSS